MGVAMFVYSKNAFDLMSPSGETNFGVSGIGRGHSYDGC